MCNELWSLFLTAVAAATAAAGDDKEGDDTGDDVGDDGERSIHAATGIRSCDVYLQANTQARACTHARPNTHTHAQTFRPKNKHYINANVNTHKDTLTNSENHKNGSAHKHTYAH